MSANNNQLILNNAKAAWTAAGQDDSSGIAVSTRIRLARNLSDTPFPGRLDVAKAREVGLKIKEALLALEKEGGFFKPDDKLNYYDMSTLSQIQRQVLFEKHFISRNLLNSPAGSEVVINDHQDIALMINEEDHLRMQCFMPGLKLSEAWQRLDSLDDKLAAKLNFAYDDKLGFLTACPTNIGTGLRASVMLHLPALVMTNRLTPLFSQLPKLGMTVRGVYGEGSESYGHLYQISNQVTLGYSEAEIIQRLHNVVDEIIAQEKKARQWLLANNKNSLLDYIWRSYGIFRNARLLTAQEAMEKISLLRLGVALDIVKDVKVEDLNRLMVECQPAFISLENNGEPGPEERDWLRAKLMRRSFGEQ
jgi:protein arginine kinase